jgi:uncharacterized delta-60 repeat protein
MNVSKKLAIGILALAFLVQCGGGGGGSDSDGTNNPPAGSLDTSFGSDGIVVTDFASNSNDEGHAIAIQSDGKIIVAGYAYEGSKKFFALVRYNPDGSLDTSFGSGGKVTTNFDSEVGNDCAYAMKIDQNGKIVVVGTRQNQKFAVVRYNTDGTLDTTFGGTGYITTDIPDTSPDIAYSLTFDATNKIIVAGYSGNDFCIVRYEEDGYLDSTFGSGGIAKFDLGTTSDYGRAVAIQQDGRILVGGDSNSQFALIRSLSDGSGLDTSFNSSGKIITSMKNGGDRGNSLLLQPDGNIIQVGFSSNSDTHSYDFALIRYTTTGVIDTTFGVNGNGKVLTNFNEDGRNDYATAAITDANNRLIVVGYTELSSNYDFVIARYDADGNLDTSFGALKFDLGSNDDRAQAVAIQSDGKIVIAGFTDLGTNNRAFALIRLWP